MRLSVEKDDPGYWPAQELIDVKVTVDGVEQKFCLTADDERGEALCEVIDADGRIVIDPESPDKIKTQTLRGTVVITVPDWLRQRIADGRARAAGAAA